MSFVVTVNSDVECPDKGVAAMTSSARLTVSNKKVVVKSDLLSATIAGCKQPASPPSSVTCATVASLIAGEAGKLTVGGHGVLLDSLSAIASGVPKNQLACKDVRQKKLTAK
jgi:hypothetical protein